ncbi:uncharacterized protein PG986_009000 [Apiospora aurea]|uniref:DUF7703 domain-containing protein n=1 Tax=Apiospora aurea TaxID=335848 RepID=A0ABR1Q6G9_9PEZI
MEGNPFILTALTRLVPRIKHVGVGIGNSINPELLTPRQRIPVVVLEAIAIWNCIELFFMIFFTLRRKRGSYFWSLLVATGGIPILATANILNNLGLTNDRILVAFLILLGWMPMVVGQAFVLYSRLHLMYLTIFQLRLVLTMIITVAIATSVPAWVLVIASNAPSPIAHRFLLPYSIYEKIQVLLYFLEESCLSALYLWKCYRFWNEDQLRARAKIRNMLIYLFFVHVLVLCLDVSIIYFEWSGNYLIQTSYKAFVYSIKLKVEFSILSSLENLVREKKLVEIRSRTRQQIEREWTQMLDSNLERGHQQHQEALTSCRDDQRPADMGESMLFETASPPPKAALALEKARLRSSSSDTMGAAGGGGGGGRSSKGNTYSIRGGGRAGRGRLYRPSASLSTFWEMASLSRSSKRGSSGTRDSGGSARHCPL